MIHEYVMGFLLFAGGFVAGAVVLLALLLRSIFRRPRSFIVGFIKNVDVLRPWLSKDERSIQCPHCGASTSITPSTKQKATGAT